MEWSRRVAAHAHVNYRTKNTPLLLHIIAVIRGEMELGHFETSLPVDTRIST